MNATLNGKRSAYPASVEDLLPRARELAEHLGRVPSRNQVMKEFKIGAPKAAAVIESLNVTAAAPELVEPAPAPVEQLPADPVPAEPVDPIEPEPAAPEPEPEPQPAVDGHPGTPTPPRKARRPVAWPVLLLALPAFVAIWSGWVGLGGLTGFGEVAPLPGIADGFVINTAITLPIGMESYAAYALWVWLGDRAPAPARRFARWSALLALAVGAAGQIAYHLLVAAGVQSAPWWITTVVACIPVAVLGMGAALAHLLHAGHAEVSS